MIKLTPKEKLVLYGLVRWPDLYDRELSDNINIKRSTVTAIRNKLVKRGVYTEHRLPDLARIGCELLVARFGDFNPLTPWDKRRLYVSNEPELFYRISTDHSRVSLVAAENFTEMKRYLDNAAHRHAVHGFLSNEGIKHAYFPFALSRMFMFFDFGPLLNKHFRLGFEEDETELNTKIRKPRTVDLNENEKKVLYAMVKYPTLRESGIAEKLSVTNQKVNKVGRRIKDKSLVRTVRFPNLAELGFELIAFSHVELNPGVSIEERRDGIEHIIRNGSQYVVVSGSNEAVMLSAFKDYTSLNKTYHAEMNIYSKRKYIDKTPTVKMFPSNEIKDQMILKCAPLLKKIFNIKEEV